MHRRQHRPCPWELPRARLFGLPQACLTLQNGTERQGFQPASLVPSNSAGSGTGSVSHTVSACPAGLAPTFSSRAVSAALFWVSFPSRLQSWTSSFLRAQAHCGFVISHPQGPMHRDIYNRCNDWLKDQQVTGWRCTEQGGKKTSSQGPGMELANFPKACKYTLRK